MMSHREIIQLPNLWRNLTVIIEDANIQMIPYPFIPPFSSLLISIPSGHPVESFVKLHRESTLFPSATQIQDTIISCLGSQSLLIGLLTVSLTPYLSIFSVFPMQGVGVPSLVRELDPICRDSRFCMSQLKKILCAATKT